MKRLFFLSLLVLMVGACSAKELEEREPLETENENENLVIGEYNENAAEDSYQASCISCHGGQLQGLSGPALVDNGLSPESIKEILQSGQGFMPAQTYLSDNEMNNLSNWLADQ